MCRVWPTGVSALLKTGYLLDSAFSFLTLASGDWNLHAISPRTSQKILTVLWGLDSYWPLESPSDFIFSFQACYLIAHLCPATT